MGDNQGDSINSLIFGMIDDIFNNQIGLVQEDQQIPREFALNEQNQNAKKVTPRDNIIKRKSEDKINLKAYNQNPVSLLDIFMNPESPYNIKPIQRSESVYNNDSIFANSILNTFNMMDKMFLKEENSNGINYSYQYIKTTDSNGNTFVRKEEKQLDGTTKIEETYYEKDKIKGGSSPIYDERIEPFIYYKDDDSNTLNNTDYSIDRVRNYTSTVFDYLSSFFKQ